MQTQSVSKSFRLRKTPWGNVLDGLMLRGVAFAILCLILLIHTIFLSILITLWLTATLIQLVVLPVARLMIQLVYRCLHYLSRKNSW